MSDLKDSGPVTYKTHLRLMDGRHGTEGSGFPAISYPILGAACRQNGSVPPLAAISGHRLPSQYSRIVNKHIAWEILACQYFIGSFAWGNHVPKTTGTWESYSNTVVVVVAGGGVIVIF